MPRRDSSRPANCSAEPSTVLVTPAQADSQSIAAFVETARAAPVVAPNTTSEVPARVQTASFSRADFAICENAEPEVLAESSTPLAALVMPLLAPSTARSASLAPLTTPEASSTAVTVTLRSAITPPSTVRDPPGTWRKGHRGRGRTPSPQPAPHPG